MLHNEEDFTMDDIDSEDLERAVNGLSAHCINGLISKIKESDGGSAIGAFGGLLWSDDQMPSSDATKRGE